MAADPREIPVESAEALFPRSIRTADGDVVEPLNCQTLFALAVIGSPLLAPPRPDGTPAPVEIPDLMIVVGLMQGDAEMWAEVLEARDVRAIRRRALALARGVGPARLHETMAAVSEQVRRGLAAFVPLRDPEGGRPLPTGPADPSPNRPTTGAGRSSSSRASCAPTRSTPGRRR